MPPKGGAVAENTAATVVACLKEIHFQERTFEALIQICKQEELGNNLALQLLDSRYDVKRLDTMASLQRAKEIISASAHVC